MFVVEYTGTFAFVKPWTAVRDGETFSQQFLTPSIIEGIEKKLFPEMLSQKGIHKIIRHKLSYDTLVEQQEVTQTRAFNKVNKISRRATSIIKRDVLLNPKLYLAFADENDARCASTQHVCLCRNEDIMLPNESILTFNDDEFTSIQGFELHFEQSEQSFIVGHNRFNDSKPMYGWIEFNGQHL